MDPYGILVVAVSAAGGAYPIPGATVLVESDDEYDRISTIARVTDRDGMTEEIALPTPPRALSLTPEAGEAPYATYRIFIRKSGYYDKLVRGVPMFEGARATLPVNLIPDTLYNAATAGPEGDSIIDVTDKLNPDI